MITNMFVLMLDQRDSRHGPDRVPALLELVNALPRVGSGLAFERTAGDEIQGTLDSPADVVAVVVASLRRPAWHLGLGIGAVDLPLPSSTRAARGPVYIAAREAVERGHRAPQHLSLVGAEGYRLDVEKFGQAVRHAQAALRLLAHLLRRRTPDGWEVADLLAAGLSQRVIAERLSITPSAVSQRVSIAGWSEQRDGADLATVLLGRADAA